MTRRRQTGRGHVARKGGSLFKRKGPQRLHTLRQTQVMNPVARQNLFVKSAEGVVPHALVERVDREDIDVDAGLNQCAHVALEKRGDARWILTGENSQSHN
jgi:hypothetical protein